MKIPSIPVLRVAALAAFSVITSSVFGQADYSTPYTVSKFAGVPGIAGANDGTNNYAQLNFPIGEAFDSNGNLYIADSGNNTIRKISPTGISSTFAGSAGNPGLSDGTGTNATFNTPSGIAVDGSGNVYVSDSGNHTIRKISSAGVVSTFAGSAGNYGSADGAGTAARFNNPIGLALTGSGDLLVVDSNNHTLRKVSSSGAVTTIAGAAGTAGSADGTGTSATFHNPHSVTVDSAGNFWVSDAGNHTIRKVTPTGAVSTFAGTAGSSGSADGSGSAARFNVPQGLAFDGSGNLFVADSGNNLLRKISPAGAVATFAGATGALRSNDGTGTAARFQAPAGLAFDGSGTLYVSDYYNHTIRKVTAAAVVTTWIGSPPLSGTADGIGAAGLFNSPYGVAVDASRNVYLADASNNTIRKISATGVVSTLAGSSGTSGYADGTGSQARFYNPIGVAVDTSGNVYVADQGNQVIRMISPAGTVTTLAGKSGAVGSTDGTGSAARFFSPAGVAVDSAGTVYVADSTNNTIRKILPGGVVSTLAGTALATGTTDGTGAAARFFDPYGIAVDSAGNVYVADTGNHTIRKITSGGVVTTVTGQAGSPGSNDGAKGTARFNFPIGLALDAAGDIFVADYSNTIVRMVTAAGLAKTIAGTAGVYGYADGVGAAAQFFDTTGVAVDALGEVYIVDSSNNAIRRALQPGAPSFSTQLPSQAVAVGQSVTFTAGASGSNLAYQWQKNGVNISSATGASYTIPSPQPGDAASYSVLVTTSSGVTAVSAPATLTVGSTVANNPPSITTQPTSQTVGAGQSVTFTVAASGSNLTYQWQKNGSNISGATNASYTIASPQASDAGSYTVVVSSGGTSVISSAATLTIGAAGGPTARLINLSVLTALANHGDTFTLGYVTGGAGTSGAKQVLVRADGPSLGAAPFNLPGTLADPKISLYDASSNLVASNAGWGGSSALAAAFAAVGAFPYPSTASLDAAALATVTTANNTVVVSAPDSGTGTVLAEVYDTTGSGSFTATTPRLINVSVLKNIGSSLTVGFVVGGSGSMKVLIRAVGPTLGAAPFNVGGTVSDPQLVLYNGASQPIGNNSGWGGSSTLSAIFSAVGAFGLPTTSKDAALTTTLTPGNYTVQVSSVSGASGTALVEVYEVP